MKNAAIVGLLAAAASAQVTYDNGTWTCAEPNTAYCAGDSLTQNIIIRCDEKCQGQPGNCNDNLAGQPPLGVSYSRCWETSDKSGDAACEKNCIVYASSPFTLPASQCTASPVGTSTSTSTHTTSPVTTATVGIATTTVCPEESSSTGPAVSTSATYPVIVSPVASGSSSTGSSYSSAATTSTADAVTGSVISASSAAAAAPPPPPSSVYSTHSAASSSTKSSYTTTSTADAASGTGVVTGSAATKSVTQGLIVLAGLVVAGML